MEKQDTGPYRKNYQKPLNIPINKDINKIRNGPMSSLSTS